MGRALADIPGGLALVGLVSHGEGDPRRVVIARDKCVASARGNNKKRHPHSGRVTRFTSSWICYADGESLPALLMI
jgi:hypothetical protein